MLFFLFVTGPPIYFLKKHVPGMYEVQSRICEGKNGVDRKQQRSNTNKSCMPLGLTS